MVRFKDFDGFKHKGGIDYIATGSVGWDIGRKGSGWTLLIKPGTVFNISVPRFLRWILSPHNRSLLLAAAVHDELLKAGHDVFFASAELRRAARVRGAGAFFSFALYLSTLVVTTITQRKRKGSAE